MNEYRKFAKKTEPVSTEPLAPSKFPFESEGKYEVIPLFRYYCSRHSWEYNTGQGEASIK